MTSMQHWTTGQWTVFAFTVLLGLAGVAMAYAARSAVLGWTAPAPLQPAPVAMLTERREPLPIRHDPMWQDYTTDGIGALTSIQHIEPDPGLRTAAELAAEEYAWVHAYDHLAPLMPETAKAREAMRIALEPVERKARLWLMRNGEVGARAVLTGWRMDTPTAEYPVLSLQYLLACALLAPDSLSDSL